MTYLSLPAKLLQFAILSLPLLFAFAHPPTVTLDYGTFIGNDNTSTGITSFLGIRFADPPTGNLRWRAAISPPSSNLGTVYATKFAPICASIGQTGDGTSEDCLFGNVFVPSGTTSHDKLPVMVWFHGGGYQEGGTPDFDPMLLMQSSEKPMIFVSFAYRLGVLGFLGGTRLKKDGQLNAGIQDQRAALVWLQRYIGKFGGDPSRVTIWGESAGAGSTMYHLLANGGDTGGLFQAAMGDSPTDTFTPTFDSDFVESLFNLFSTNAGCGTNANNNVLTCLRSAKLDVLTDAWDALVANRTSTLFNFAPILDGDFIAVRPVEAFTTGRFANVPVLFGSNTNEGAGWSAQLPNPATNTTNPNATEETVFHFLRGAWDTLTQESFDRAVGLYYPLVEFSDSFDRQGQQMYGEVRYICLAGLITEGVTRWASGGSRAYQYRYDNPHLGSNHANELGAFFPASTPPNADDEDLALFEVMREFFTSFVTTGTPTSRTAVGLSWDPVADYPDTSNDIDGNPRILFRPGGIAMEQISDELNENCAFWHSLGDEMQI
ncbi:alpha/beta-hydrolase [Dendrothele bispora CBS 962.96]|uniref:Carboxylic ester hydrolase n=1 Tax=Dendrothele bispora (strain CBS 962.96) TaxID=1314807 RepID=A0A4S8MRE8_DENBC|nr:alpha/beta-hydrolase [Dendrothele bispora CBS 962.96]